MESSKLNFKKTIFWWRFGFIFLLWRPVFAAEAQSMVVNRQGAQLEYRVTLTKPVYLLHEPAAGVVWVKNISDKAVTTRVVISEGWFIFDQDGKRFKPQFSDLYLPVEIKPGDSLGGVVGLEGYGILHRLYRLFYFPLGDYTVYYKVGRDSTARMHFRVVEPTGEDAEALKFFLEANSVTTGKEFFGGGPEVKDSLFREEVRRLQLLADRYPKSFYAYRALTSSFETAHNILHDGELLYDINARLMRQFPQTRADAIDFLREYYKSHKDMDGFRKELEKIIEENLGSNLTAAAKKALEKLEEKQ